jgi:hypothetical protein
MLDIVLNHIDPFLGYDKRRLFDYGKMQLEAFLNLNGLRQPKAVLTYDEALAPERRNTYESRVLAKILSGPAPTQGTGTGWYKNGLIFVSLQRASRCIFVPRMQNWSHPHYRVDREPAGVVCHEGGHHVQELLRRAGRFDERKWRSVVWGTTEKRLNHFSKRGKMGKLKVKRVTNYEPNLDESFAETMRLFILNPGLVQAGLEPRFDFITKDCGLEPILILDWKQLLEDFHPSFTIQAAKWIAL